MDRPTVLDINCATGEQIQRPMNDDEFAQWLKDQEQPVV